MNPLVSIQCLEHNPQLIGALDVDPNAKKLGYCFECMMKGHTEGTLPKVLKNFQEYLNETSDFYEKCRQRVPNGNEPPAEYIDELSKKAERLETLSKHLDKEKEEIKKRFDDIRTNILQLIEAKEKECLKLVEEEMLNLSYLYGHYEKLLATGWLKLSEIEAIYPTADALQQKISRIGNIDQLQAFMAGVTEDIQIENVYSNEKAGSERRKNKINHLLNCFQKIESSLPEFQGKLLDSEDLESLVKELLKEFSQQEIKVENSFAIRMNELLYNSKIIQGEQYEILKGWLPNSHNLGQKLLYRGSVDGMSCETFHKKCDGQGGTVTLIKCRFNGAPSSSVIGGFVDQSWHSNNVLTASNTAFLFSMTPGTPSIQCPILESECLSALYGHSKHGPIFGGRGHDLWIHEDFKTGSVGPSCYSNSVALRYKNEGRFTLEEIEVFQVY